MAVEHHLRNAALLLATAGFASLASCANGPPKNEAATTTAAASAPVIACNFGAFVAESDPASLNVRAEPSPSTEVLGKLPRTFVEPSAGYGVGGGASTDLDRSLSAPSLKCLAASQDSVLVGLTRLEK